jgi:hypothetical protein
MFISKRISLPAIALFLFSLAFFIKPAHAAGPELFITWKARTYVPAEYPGKILPTADSELMASLDVINQGKVVDISGQTVYWYVNGDLVSNSKGVHTITFRAPKSLPNIITVKAELPFYGGKDSFKEIAIPVVPPEAVIQASYPNGNFYGGVADAKAAPYFFNISSINSLNFTWSVNGQIPTSSDSPSTLSVNTDPNMPVGSTLLIALSITNPANPNEAATKILNLIRTQ